MAMRFSRMLVFLALATVLPACDMFFGPDTGPACIDNLDCALGQECNPDSLTCQNIVSQKPLSVIDLELTPLKDSGFAATQIGGLDLKKVADTNEITLMVDDSVALQGRIPSPDAMGGLPGTLVATRRAGFDDRKLTWNITVSEDGGFEQTVASGVYNLLFKPSNREGFPQLMLCGLEIPSQSPPDLGYLQFADPATADLDGQDPLLVVRGQVLQSQAYPHPMNGITVDGVTDQGLYTSTATPDEQGVFYLRLPFTRVIDEHGERQEIFPVTVDVTLRPSSGDVRLPTVTVPGIDLSGADLGTFYIGDVPASHSLSGVVLDSSGRPVADCQLRYTAENIGNGSLTMQGQTDSTGHFATTLPEGSYQVKVIPDLLSTSVMQTVNIELTSDQSTNINLSDRPRLSGIVTDSSGLPAAGIAVKAKRLSTVSGVEDGVVRSYSGITAEDGSFELEVDFGRYSVTFIPTAASGLPRSLPRVAYITGDYYAMDASATKLAQPTLIQGHVFDANGAPICGVTIDVFHSPNDESSQLVGQAISGGIVEECGGSYAAIIPGNLFP